MPDPKRNPEKETPHKDKLCKTCGRFFSWRKSWERDWDVIKYCSDVCRGYQPGEADAALEAAILELLQESGKAISPNDAAKSVGGKDTRRDWEGLLEPARAAARRLSTRGSIVLMQHGAVVSSAKVRGPFLLRLR